MREEGTLRKRLPKPKLEAEHKVVRKATVTPMKSGKRANRIGFQFVHSAKVSRKTSAKGPVRTHVVAKASIYKFGIADSGCNSSIAGVTWYKKYREYARIHGLNCYKKRFLRARSLTLL